MAAVMSLKLALVAALLCMGVATHYATEAAISCGTVDKAVIPCLNYLEGKGPLTGGCCSSISSLNSMASTTPDRQQACKCLKQAASSYSSINPSTAAGLPGKCGVSLPYKISTSTNCASVK